MMTGNQNLPNYLPSPARRTPTREFDYQDLIADAKFHAVVEEHRRRGAFNGLQEGAPGYNAVLKEIALAFVRVVNEKRATLFRNRGISYGRESAFREAVSCYNRALELSTNSPSRHVTLANRSAAYIKIRKYPEALEDAQEAANLSSEYSIARSLMGYCQSQLGMMKEAVVNYHLALQLNPADTSSRGLLEDAKNALLNSGVTPETIEELERPFAPKPPVEGDSGRHRRYLDTSSRTKSLQEMVRKASAIDIERQKAQGEPVDFAPERRARSREGSERPRLSRKLSNSGAQAFASLTQLPNKLKTAITTKARGRSDRKTEHSPDIAQELSLQSLSLTAGDASGAAVGGAPSRPPPPLETQLRCEAPALEPSWAGAVATAGCPQMNSNAPIFHPAEKQGRDSSAAPDFSPACGNPSQGGGNPVHSGNAGGTREPTYVGPDFVNLDVAATAAAAAATAKTSGNSDVPSSAGGPVEMMRGQGGTGGGAASPDTVGYNEELLKATRRSPDPPPYTTARGECPGAPAPRGHAEAQEAQGRKKERLRAEAAAYRPGFLPPEPNTGTIPPCPPAPRLGPVEGPGRGEKPTTAHHIDEAEWQGHPQIDNRTYSDQHPPNFQESVQVVAGQPRGKSRARRPLRPPETDLRGWTSSDSEDGQLHAAANFTAASSLPQDTLYQLPSYSDLLPEEKGPSASAARPVRPLAMGKTEWTSSEDSGSEDDRLRSRVAAGFTGEGRGTPLVTVAEKVWDCPEAVAGTSVDCEGEGEPGCEGKPSGPLAEEAETRPEEAEAARQGRDRLRHVDGNHATGAGVSRPPGTCAPDLATSNPTARALAQTIGQGSVRAAIDLFERTARSQVGFTQHVSVGTGNTSYSGLRQFSGRRACGRAEAVATSAGALASLSAAEKALYYKDAVKRLTTWVTAVTMQTRGNATLPEWFRDGTVLVLLVNAVKPGIAKPRRERVVAKLAKQWTPSAKEPAGGAQPVTPSTDPAAGESAPSNEPVGGVQSTTPSTEPVRCAPSSDGNEEEEEIDPPTSTENLNSFFEACANLGVPKKHIFCEEDLKAGREGGLERVVACLEALGSTAAMAAPGYLGPTLKPPTPPK